MLQGVRDNLKGTIVTSVIVLFFILPMVITGVGSSWLGSVAGTDAAVVDGRTITNSELSREIYMQKQRLLSQDGVDPSADFLKDENLRKPVLDRLTRKAAILAAADEGGMGISDVAVNSVIVTQPDFQVDGKFNAQQYRSLLSRIGHTPATYKSVLEEDLLLGQLNGGLEMSGFVTEAEKQALVAIIHEKRTFYTVDIPVGKLADKVAVSDSEAEEYYQQHQQEFSEAEKVAVEYIELSVNKLANLETVTDEEVRTQYEAELNDFNSDAEYKIAHILIKDGDDSAAKVADLQQKLAAGDDFAELAKAYSEDSGTKAQGGSLGTMVKGVFPEAFENAVTALNTGEVSAPVTTDAGTHLIKVTEKITPEPPSFEERKDKIARDLKRAKAEETYVSNISLLEELTFSSPDLANAAEELGLDVLTSGKFERTSGVGIAGNPEVRNAAFEADVLVDGHNSRVIELAGNRAIVLRVKEHSPEHIKDLELVKSDIVSKLTQEKIIALQEEKAEAFIASIHSGADAEKLATELGYAYTLHEEASRTDPVSDPKTRATVFSAAVTGADPQFETAANADSSYRVIAVLNKQPGALSDLSADESNALAGQLNRENSRFEGGAFEAAVVASADIKLN